MGKKYMVIERVVDDAIVYRRKDRWHRISGPAVIFFNGTLSFYRNNRFCGKISSNGVCIFFDPATDETMRIGRTGKSGYE